MWLIGVIVDSVCLSPFASAASFTPLGDLSGGDFYSQAYAVSADGKVVVGTSNSSRGYEPFRWSVETEMIGLNGLPTGSAQAVSADGSVIVGSARSTMISTSAFRWTEETGMVFLQTFPVYSTASAVTADGSIIFGLSGVNDTAARWPATEGVENFNLPFSDVAGTSADGSVVVGARPTGAARWTQATGWQSLGSGRRAYAVSADGSVIVGHRYTIIEDELFTDGFRWTQEDGIIILGPGSAYGVSANGSITVGTTDDLSGYAFIWDEIDGTRSIKEMLSGVGIDLTGWTLRQATGVSANGKIIVGTGLNPDGNMEAWLADLTGVIPEPSTAAIVMGLAGLSLKQRRRRMSVTKPV